MADNVDVTEGSGKTIKTEDEGGVQYQVVKLAASGSGTTEALSKAEDAGHSSGDHGIMALTVRQDTAAALSDTDADYQPLITDANGRLHVLDQNSAAILTALQIIDDWDDSDKCNVNMNVAGTDVAANAGTLNAQTLRVTIATDDECNNLLGTIDADTGAIKTATELIDDVIYIDDADWSDGSSKHALVGGLYQSSPQTVTNGDVAPFQIDVNGCLVLGTGAKAIGKLAANTGVDIGDVDVTSIVPGVGATNLGKAEDAGHSSGDVGVAAMTVRANTATSLSGSDNDYQPLITDTNGRLHVLDQNSAAILTALQIIDDWDDSNFCNVNLNLAGTDASADEGTIDATTLRVTIATDDDGVAHLATIAGDTTAIETAIEIMDDWDATHASAAPADGAQVMGAAYSTALPTDVGADADAARLVTDRYGRLCTGLQPQAAKAIVNNADTTTAREIVAATATRRIFVTSLIISVDTAGNYWLEDGDATAVTGKMYFAANGGCAITFPEGTPLNTVTQNKALNVKGSTAGNVSVTVTYYLAV